MRPLFFDGAIPDSRNRRSASTDDRRSSTSLIVMSVRAESSRMYAAVRPAPRQPAERADRGPREELVRTHAAHRVTRQQEHHPLAPLPTEWREPADARRARRAHRDPVEVERAELRDQARRMVLGANRAAAGDEYHIGRSRRQR